ncbi:hypothetical protein G7054_g7479 [Neopestalotiopsis clavispora]|nr:hypothetical protein G7054_g7479 [Neopestalotiopsis clavispora]
MPEGRQSPPPERQSGAQKDQPASGQGLEQINTDSKKGEQQDQLKNLSSNPKGPLDDALEAKFTKTEK